MKDDSKLIGSAHRSRTSLRFTFSRFKAHSAKIHRRLNLCLSSLACNLADSASADSWSRTPNVISSSRFPRYGRHLMLPRRKCFMKIGLTPAYVRCLFFILTQSPFLFLPHYKKAPDKLGSSRCFDIYNTASTILLFGPLPVTWQPYFAAKQTTKTLFLGHFFIFQCIDVIMYTLHFTPADLPVLPNLNSIGMVQAQTGFKYLYRASIQRLGFGQTIRSPVQLRQVV